MVYHWTTIKNSKLILRTGLRKYSFVCKEPKGWRGEVCLEIKLDVDWTQRDSHASWQAITHRVIQPCDITLVKYKGMNNVETNK
jgi:hypothetical protein